MIFSLHKVEVDIPTFFHNKDTKKHCLAVLDGPVNYTCHGIYATEMKIKLKSTYN